MKPSDEEIRVRSKSQRPEGQSLEALVLEILGAFFDLRAMGQELGMVNEWGAGNWGLLRILKEEGAKTVPQVAKMRSVSRQYIQKLANELQEEGLITMIENPIHKRSKLMQLTFSGERKLEELSQQYRDFLANLECRFRPEDVVTSVKTIATFRQLLSEASSSVDGQSDRLSNS